MKKQKAHELVSLVKNLALDLGKTPTRAQFEKAVKGGKYKLEAEYQTYQKLLDAAGLESLTVIKKKISDDIFRKDLEIHLAQYEPRENLQPYQIINFKGAKIASISDIHWPFSCQKVIDAFIIFCEVNKVDFIIINGDAWDMYCHSKYPKSINIYTPRDEERIAREMNVEFWKRIKKACPKAKCFQLLGNHDIRPLKRVIEEYPAAEDWVQEHFKKLFSFDGVTTIFDYRQELIINDIAIFHGYRSKLGDHRDYTHMKCMIGHTHNGGVVFRQINRKVIWELNSGTAGDIESKALSYTAQKMTHQTKGFSYVDEYGPRFIPL